MIGLNSRFGNDITANAQYLQRNVRDKLCLLQQQKKNQPAGETLTLSKAGILTVNTITQHRYRADQTNASANWIGNKQGGCFSVAWRSSPEQAPR